jgi:hypothetical protein
MIDKGIAVTVIKVFVDTVEGLKFIDDDAFTT